MTLTPDVLINNYILGSYVYGAVRSIVYTPPGQSVPKRIQSVFLHTAMSPALTPLYIVKDIKNIRSPKIDRFPWYQ